MESYVDPLTGGIKFRKIEVQTGTSWFLESAKKQIEALNNVSEENNEQNLNREFNPQPSLLGLDQKMDLIQKVGEEIINLDEIKKLFQEKKHPICYDGFEPSGRMHIA